MVFSECYDSQEDYLMTLIFPATRTYDSSTGPTTTDRIRCIADVLRSKRVGRFKLAAACRKSIEPLITGPYRNEPGPIRWRLFAEVRSGGKEEVIQALRSLESTLSRIVTVGLEPGAVERLEELAEQLDRTMDREPAGGRERFRWLCSDVIDRLESEVDARGLGDFDVHIDEMASLGVVLGFPSPPIQQTCFERGGTNRIRPAVGEIRQDPIPWININHSHPEFMHVYGYRLHDPLRSSHRDYLVSAIVKSDDPSKPRLYDPWEDRPLTDDRQGIVRMVRRWVSAVDGMPRVEKADCASDTANKSEQGVDPKVLELLRQSITVNGIEAKASVVIKEAKVRESDGYAGLRVLQESGEYKGHVKRAKPRSLRK